MIDKVLFTYAEADMPPLRRAIIRGLERATGQQTLETMYRGFQKDPIAGESFFQAAVRLLRLSVQYDPQALAAVPKSGATVVVANHPFGVLDGIVISYLIEKVRADFLVLTNAVLLKAPEVRRTVLGVDFAATPQAREMNLRSRAAARAHLDQGGCVVVFPAGGVSTTEDRFGRGEAIDAPWQPFTAQLIQRSKATVVPIRFIGQNSRVFHIASHLSQTLRVAMIFHEVRRRIGKVLPVAIGASIPFSEIAGIVDRKQLLDMLRERTQALQVPAPRI